MSSTSPSFGRRRLFAGTGLGLAAAAGLSACGGGDASSGSGEVAELPTYTPIGKVPAPDLEGTEVARDAYFRSPPEDELLESVAPEHMPTTTDPINGFVITFGPPGPSKNSFLEHLGENLKTTLSTQIVPADSYTQKLTTVVAGGDIPDMVEFLRFDMPANYPQMLEAQFQDISEFVSGDKIADYPNLANIPTASWDACRIDGRIYGTPIHRAPFGNAMQVRRDIVKKATGEEPAPTNLDEFMTLLDAVHDPGAGQYALGGHSTGEGVNWGQAFIDCMYRVPNVWKLDGSELIHRYETAEFLEAVALQKTLWDGGYFHPDTPTMAQSQAKTTFANGSVVLYADGPAALFTSALPEDAVPGLLTPFAADGGEGVLYKGLSIFSFTALKKADDARIQEQLKVLNYLSAPFGSTEQFFLTYGTEGEHHTRAQDGTPELTELGRAEIGPSAVFRLANNPSVNFQATPMDERTRHLHAWEVACEPILLENPVEALYSETAAKTASENAKVEAAVTDYILDRSDLQGLKDTISAWTTKAGDPSRAEYLEQLEQAGS